MRALLLSGLLLLAPAAANAQERPEDRVCRESVDCVERGACVWHDGQHECVAYHVRQCQASKGCREGGRCSLDTARFRCDAGVRSDPGLFYGGIAVMATGGALVVGGALLAMASAFRGLSSAVSGRGGDDSATTVALVMVVAGPVLAVGVGLPMLVAGNSKVPRKTDSRAYFGLGPAGVGFAVTF